MKNILISSAGQRVSLVRSFMKEMDLLLPGSKLYAVDADISMSPACHVAHGAFIVPKVTDPNYLGKMLDLCRDLSVKLVIPTIDTELEILSAHRQEFSDIGVEVLVSDIDFIRLCRDKRITNDFFAQNGIAFPKVIDKNNPTFPLFIKPYDGSLSKDIYKIYKKEELTEYHLNNEKLMFMDLVDTDIYKEFTVDAYYNVKSDLICAIPRERIHVRAGEVSKSRTAKNYLHDIMFEKLSNLSGVRGSLTIQFFLSEHSNNIFAIEINPRFGGGYPLSYYAGGNFPRWIIEEYFLQKVIPPFFDWKEDLLMLRYDGEIIIDVGNEF